MKMILSIIKWVVIVIILLALLVVAFTQFHPTFGGKPDEQSLQKIHASVNFDGEKFVNLEPTVQSTAENGSSLLAWVWGFLNPPKGKNPSEPLPTDILDKTKLTDGSVVWLGHSSVLMKIEGKILLTDPVFYRASPLPYTGLPFKMINPPTINDLPQLDAVLISHDHYDHLDYQAIQGIDAKTRCFIVPLGVKAHLQRWGIADNKIIELDWDEQINLDDIAVTLVPARHFSGRRLGANNPTLWGGYVIKSPSESLYFSADSGYGKHYRERIAQYGPFDFVMIENGAYDKDWAMIHEFPEQAIQAVKDLNATKVMPIHWGKFDLANHNWQEPIEQFTQLAEQANFSVATPKIGQIFNINQSLPNEKWWRQVK